MMKSLVQRLASVVLTMRRWKSSKSPAITAFLTMRWRDDERRVNRRYSSSNIEDSRLQDELHSPVAASQCIIKCYCRMANRNQQSEEVRFSFSSLTIHIITSERPKSMDCEKSNNDDNTAKMVRFPLVKSEEVCFSSIIYVHTCECM